MDPIKRKRLNSFLCNVAKTSRIISQTVSGVDLPAIPLPSRNTKPPTLPPPPNILSELEATGAPTSVIMQELEKFEQGCRTLRRQTEAILCRLAQSTLDLPSLGGSKPDTPLRSSNFLESIYLKQVLNLKACTLKRVHAASANKSLRVRFNQESTPLLEKYFKNNAYPSQADRAMLAKKTRMTMRQIDVWFQNHRARGRREGIVLKRHSCDANPDDYTFEPLESEATSSALSSRSRSSSSSPENMGKESDEENAPKRQVPMNLVFQWITRTPIDIVKSSPPPHAFPTRFSAEQRDKFPFTPTFAAFEWERKPSPTPKSTPKQKPVDVDNLTDDFRVQLRIFDQPRTGCLKRKRSSGSIDLSTPPTKKHVVSRLTPHPQSPRGSPRTPPQSEFTPLPKGTPKVCALKRQTIPRPRRLCSTSVSSINSRSCSWSSDCSSSASSNPPCSTPSTSPTPACSNPYSIAPPLSQHFFSQRLGWHTSKFVQWSSLPVLTLNFTPQI